MLEAYLPIITVSLGAVVIILIILSAVLFSKIGKLQKRVDTFTFGIEDADPEKVIKLIQKDIRDLELSLIHI